MDLVAEPSHIYHSGHDLLSGQYRTQPLPGDKEHKAENLSITKNEKGWEVKDDAASLGTTPRRLTDLIGSLCDLTSGSGDKGTPVILIQGYFDNYVS